MEEDNESKATQKIAFESIIHVSIGVYLKS